MSRVVSLVDAGWVQRHLDDPQIVIAEVDEDVSAYGRGHIPGAVSFDWKNDLQDPVRRDFVDRKRFEELLSERGIAPEHTVVLYGGNNNWFAAYAYWYFKIYGHEQVRLLDGGREIWQLQARPVTEELPQRPRLDYVAKEQDLSIRAFRDEVLASLVEDLLPIGQKNLIDVRSPQEFAGEMLAPAHLPQEQAQQGGHIPSARNVPWSKAANEDGTFKSDEQLQALFRDAGIDFDRDTIIYCHIGERSAHTWFVVHELLDHPNVKNYDGSWSEYGSMVGVPIEK
jgi:thiosulfate/3-mercaptopyruvate sulfurtransferase